ncbi:MAG: hypothetical protein A2622_05265 [Bdellovibrionales bacterium RIFCSPHIGHO2_01_FULL_40_29]|nr:MAG: hypothetical protein A2622_05265 [Bdellovibrionales bacterium RIFCSPHIGHO2_01_FULL_40_29]OFZ34891.1 MAG: hypothetical protein A3D17_10110 [Bdellovibrionales bacterium RIFCSPHIGHO2_02_FULL_40_15]
MHKIRGHVLGFIVWIIYRILSATWRVRVVEDEALRSDIQNKQAVILSHFHQDELVLISLAPRYKIATMTSTSKDGEIMTTVLRLLGARISRGSSTRGGVSALKGLIQLCKNGSNSTFAVDGPKGPLYEPKAGVFEFSRLLKSPIYAAGVACDRAWHFPRAWNKTFLPKPFARVFVVWTKAQDPVTKDQDPRSPELAKTLKNQLFAARQHATNLFGAQKP